MSVIKYVEQVNRDADDHDKIKKNEDNRYETLA